MLVFEQTKYSSLLFDFSRHLVGQETLEQEDMFVINNCSIHMQGENKYLQEDLFSTLGILMIPLLPYHHELNPTELFFDTLVQRLRSKKSRSSSTSSVNLKKG